MSTSPPIKYSGPVVSPDVPWETRRHLQLIYQKLTNHTQAFQFQAKQIAGIKTGSTTTNIVEQGGGSGGGGGSSTFIGQGLINDQSGEVGYATQPGDNGILLIVNDASPVAVTLTTDAAPFYLIITNLGAGTATLTPSTGTLNGGASLSLLQNQTVYVACDSTNWFSTAVPVPPQDTPAVTHEWINAYNAATGAFTQTQPAVGDVTGAAPLASPALTGTPTAPTASPLTNNTQVATTAYADAAVAVEKARAQAAEGLLAPIASPTFTGTVTQPTPSVVTGAATDTSATAGAATALPATPAGYLEMSVNGTTVKIPYYSV